MIVGVIDWNLYSRYYEVSEADLKTLMLHPRKDRKDLFRQFSKPTNIHCEDQIEIFLPIYTDDDWDEHEEIFKRYFTQPEGQDS